MTLDFQGDIIERSGYHKPGSNGLRTFGRGCGCHTPENQKTVPRDIIVKQEDGTRIRYYHQTPVVKKQGTQYTLNAGGWHTNTTKERINKELPRGWYLIQEDYEWYIRVPNGGKIRFESGMELDTATGQINYRDGRTAHAEVT